MMEGNPKLSIVTVSYNCRDFVELLIKSVKKFTTWPYELIVIDNNSEDRTRELLRQYPWVRSVPLPSNIGHGRGLNAGLALARGQYCLILDADAHLMRAGFEDDFLSLYENPGVRLVCAKGSEDPDTPILKAIHPFFMFFDTQLFRELEVSFIADDQYDVGRKIFYILRDRGMATARVEAGVSAYPGAYGCTYHMGGREFLYHNWYSSRMWNKTIVDDYMRTDFDRYKEILFGQPLVKEILANGGDNV